MMMIVIRIISKMEASATITNAHHDIVYSIYQDCTLYLFGGGSTDASRTLFFQIIFQGPDPCCAILTKSFDFEATTFGVRQIYLGRGPLHLLISRSPQLHFPVVPPNCSNASTN